VAVNRRAGLAALAEQASQVYADVGPAAAQAWMVAAVDALAHALVDLADDRADFTRHTQVHALRLLGAPHGGDDDGVDRASCAAAATELRRLRHEAQELLVGPGACTTKAGQRATRAMDLLVGALDDLAAVPPGDARAGITRAAAMRGIRSAYRLLQPEGSQPAGDAPRSGTAGH